MAKRIIAAIVILGAIAILADRQGLFGVHEEQIPDILHLTIRFIDVDSRAPVSEVHIACTRPMIRSACTERPGPRMGQTTITFRVMKRSRHTLLFSKDAGYALGREGVMNLTFIHPDYERGAMEFSDNQSLWSSGRAPVVELMRSDE